MSRSLSSNQPILSSHQAGWSKLQLALYQQPPNGIAEYRPNQHVICVNLGRAVTLDRRVDGRSQTLDAVPQRDIGIYPALVPQAFQWYQNAEFLQLYLEPSVLLQAAGELAPNHNIEVIPQLALRQDPLIYGIAISLKAALETDPCNSGLYADTLASSLALHLLYRYSSHQPKPPKTSSTLTKSQLQQVTDFIQANLERNIGLDELAAIAQLSPFHFARMFKLATELAPHQFLIRCRIERAQQLLLKKKLSCAEVAYAVGFASQSHLNYHFKLQLGTTPKAFLDNH